MKGAKNVKKKFPHAILIMLLPPSFAVQEARLRGRGTEKEEKIRERLKRTREELCEIDCYDYVVYNYDGKDLDAAQDILAILRAEHRSIRRNTTAKNDYFA